MMTKKTENLRASSLLVAVLGACGLTEDAKPIGSLAFEAGAPSAVGYGVGGTNYEVCIAVAQPGGTIRLTEITEGTIQPTTGLPLADTAPNASCPMEVAGKPAQGWAVFRWLTKTGRASAQVRYTRGPIVQASYIQLEGDPFPGYVAELDGEVVDGDGHHELTFTLHVADVEMTPAPAVPFALEGAPEDITVTFPTTLKTDASGKAHVVIEAVMEPTDVFITPANSDMQLLAELEPPAASEPPTEP